MINNRDLVIDHYEYLNVAYEQQVKKLNQELKKKKNTVLGVTIGGITVTAGLLLFILLK